MKLIFVVLAVGFTSALACRPIWRMYESRGYGNDYVENGAEMVVITDVTDIADYGMEHFRMYTCPQGVWVGFAYPMFGGYSNVESNYYKKGGVLRCSYQNTGRVFQSLKIVGNPDDYTASALTTFQVVGNEGAATTYLEETEQIFNRRFLSMILMGSEEMEIFTGANYTGDSFCIGPNHGLIYTKSDYDRKNEWRNGTDLYTNIYNVETILGSGDLNSFRFGCDRSKQL